MWIERTTFTTVYKLPGILRWFEATDLKHVSLWQFVFSPGLFAVSFSINASIVLPSPDDLVSTGERHRNNGVHQWEDPDHD